MEMKPLRNMAELLEGRARQSLLFLALISAAFTQACSTLGPESPPASEPTTFESDGCSGVPDGPHSDPQRWRAACVKHDHSYWAGGNHRDRLVADQKLKVAIKESGYPLTSEIYFIGTRFGGSPYLPSTWRWDFGQPWPTGYQKSES